MAHPLLPLAVSLAMSTQGLNARLPAVLAPLAALEPELRALYIDLHRSPELSFQEKRTAQKLAARLTALGFDVTEGVGGPGIVAVLRNGDGPVLMLRTDLDALPVEEKTGLPYASRVTATGANGQPVPVMHACGHDLHMTSWAGAATLLARGKQSWRGTLVLVGQPAEELGGGAEAMLKDGLLSRFPRPDHAVALHVTNELPAGQAAATSGAAFASTDSVDITVFGKGGHGALPQRTVDPIVIASRIVLSLQTLVSRERDPFDPAVVTVGSFHGGTKHNVIPDEVRLQLTVRAFREEVRLRLLEGIRRIAKAEALAAAAPREPEVTVSDPTPSVYNDPAFTTRVLAALASGLGSANVSAVPPVSVSEDFALFGREVPAVQFWLGVAEPKAWAAAKAGGKALPSLHSSQFAPEPEGSIRAGVTALTAIALDVLPAR